MRISLFLIVLCLFACKNDQKGNAVSSSDEAVSSEIVISPEKMKAYLSTIEQVAEKAAAVELSYVELENKLRVKGGDSDRFIEKAIAGRSEVSQLVIDLNGYKKSGQRGEGFSDDMHSRITRIQTVVLPEHELALKALQERVK
jgi:hypothetical protein